MRGALKAMGVKADSNVDAASTLDWEPCEGFTLRKVIRAENMLGRTTEHWACDNPQTRVEIQQWYDPQLRLVVRNSRAGGRVSDFRNIRLTERPDSLFQLPQGIAKYRSTRWFNVVPGAFVLYPFCRRFRTRDS
jgi:hypothetical protein